MSRSEGEYFEHFHQRVLDRRSIQGIQQEVDRLDSRNELVKYFTADSGKEKIAGWKSELTWILQVFNVCLMYSYFVTADHFLPRPNWV